jgi:hypothetical protein|tara:strand:- start:5959 stop:6894 length:936 start_codon:yes stop_codon:yes gene_type:complete
VKEDKSMAEPLNQELEFDVGEDDQEETTVEMNEDGTDAQVATEEEIVVEETKKGAAPQTEELEKYSGKVKKRIDKLTARLRETQRREEAAVAFAKNVQMENETLQQKNHKTDGERLHEAQGRITSHALALKQVIKKAREEGDIDTETEAQQRLTAAMMEQQRVQESTALREQQPQIQPTAPVAPPSPPPQSDLKAEEWAEGNEWFGTNTVMTHAVRGIHIDLVQKEGFDPTTDEYYDEIDRRIRVIFPNEFEPTPTQPNRTRRPVQPVAPATRSSGVNNSARRTVRLSPSQVAIAKRIGVPLEEYAKHVKE